VDRTVPQRLAKFPQKLDLGGIALIDGGSSSASVVHAWDFGGAIGDVNISVPRS